MQAQRIGDRHPTDPRRVWVGCPLKLSPVCRGERYTPTSAPLKLIAAGAAVPCRPCSLVKTDPVPLPSGAAVRRDGRTPEEFRRRVGLAECVVCGEEHELSVFSRGFTSGMCDACKGLARTVLTNEQLSREGDERNALYERINRLREVLYAAGAGVAEGPQMPFCALAKRWLEEPTRRARSDSTSESMQAARLYQAKYAAFYFGETPISGVGADDVLAFQKWLAGEERTRGRLTPITVNRIVGAVEKMYDLAERRGWVGQSPVLNVPPLYAQEESEVGRVLTAAEEAQLLGACVGKKFGPLRSIIICHLDAGVTETERRSLSRCDFDLERGVLSVRGRRGRVRLARLTPRLAEVVRLLGDGPLPVEWSRPVRGAKLRALCAAAGVDNVVWLRDLKRTGEARAAQASPSPKRERAFTEAEAEAAIKSLGSRLSVSELSRVLECARPTIGNYAKSKGYASGQELVKARLAAREGV